MASETPKAQIDRLRDEVAGLAAKTVNPAVADLAAKAQRTLGNATEVVRGHSDALSVQVRQRPFTTMLVAVAVGWVLARASR